MDETPIRAVEMVRSIRDQFYEQTKWMSPEELIAFITSEASHAAQNDDQNRAREAAA